MRALSEAYILLRMCLARVSVYPMTPFAFLVLNVDMVGLCVSLP